MWRSWRIQKNYIIENQNGRVPCNLTWQQSQKQLDMSSLFEKAVEDIADRRSEKKKRTKSKKLLSNLVVHVSSFVLPIYSSNF